MTQLLSDHHFKLSLPGLDTLGLFQECSGLSMEFDVFEWFEGGNNEFVHHLPGRLRYPPLVLCRGMTDQQALQEWFWKTRERAELKEVVVEMRTPSARTRRTWTFADAYPIRWSGPHIAAHGSAIAIETLEIVHSGLKMA